MAGLGDLVIRLFADTGEFESDMGKAAHVAQRELESIATKAAIVGEVAGRAISRIAEGFIQAGVEAVKMGDELSKLSQRTGMTVERLSEMRFAAELADVGFGQLQSGLGMFNKTLQEAQDEGTKAARLFEALGVSVKEGPQVAFEQFAKAINGLPDGETKVAAMRTAFGRAGDALIPMIAQLDDATDKARKLGIVMSADLAADSNRLNDALTTLSATTRAMAIEAFTPSISALATMSERLVTAQGLAEKLALSFQQAGMAIAAVLGTIDRAFGGNGRFDKLAEGMFIDDARRAATMASGSGAAATATTDAGAVSAALGRQEKDVKQKAKDDSEFVARQIQWGVDEETRIQIEAWNAVGESRNRQIEADQAAEAARWKAIFDGIDREQEEAVRQSEVMVRYTETETARMSRQSQDEAKKLGMVFVSAAEESIRHWQGFGNLIKNIGLDIAQMIFRQQVTTPIANAVGKGLEGFSLSSVSGLFGGSQVPAASAGWTSGYDLMPEGAGGLGALLDTFLGSFAVGTDYVPADGLAMIHRGEAIIPAAENTGGGRGMQIFADMRGASAEAVARLEKFVARMDATLERRAVSAVAESNLRGSRP